jgi:hypothetical protein
MFRFAKRELWCFEAWTRIKKAAKFADQTSFRKELQAAMQMRVLSK